MIIWYGTERSGGYQGCCTCFSVATILAVSTRALDMFFMFKSMTFSSCEYSTHLCLLEVGVHAYWKHAFLMV
jgi:hypothetical protein